MPIVFNALLTIPAKGLGQESALFAFWNDFYNTDQALAAFVWSLPPLQRTTEGECGPDVSPTELVPELTFGHVMAYGAIIQLHNSLARQGHPESVQKCFQAARGVMKRDDVR